MPKNKAIAAIAIVIAAAAIITGIALSQPDDTIDLRIDGDVNATENELIQQKLDAIENQTKANREKLLESDYDPSRPRIWMRSGPFEVDRETYYMGEKVFLRIGGLQYTDKGQIAFLRPQNATHYEVYLTIPFDGAKKSAFNYYISPQLSKARGICSADDIIGDWAVVFKGTNYPTLHFSYINQTIPGYEEKYYNPVC